MGTVTVCVMASPSRDCPHPTSCRSSRTGCSDPCSPAGWRLVLDYHGLTGQPAGTLRGIATRHGVSTVTVSTHVRAVRAAGARLPIPPAVITAATRRSAPSDDHLSRVRIARTLGLPVPSPWRPAPMPRDDAVPSSALRVARVAARVLAAVGPLEDDTLLAAVTRSRRFRHRTPLI